MEAMEEWGHADDRVIQRSYTAEACISCAWFSYGMDAHCHTFVGCALIWSKASTARTAAVIGSQCIT